MCEKESNDDKDNPDKYVATNKTHPLYSARSFYNLSDKSLVAPLSTSSVLNGN